MLESYDSAYDWGTQYSPMLVKENADRDGVTYVMERTEEFPGVVVNDDYVRNYPAGDTAAHILGYTGAITQQELKLNTFKGLANDSVVGKSGVELYYEKVLRGEAGEKVYKVDALGRIVPDGSRIDSLGRFVDENGEPMAVDPSKELPDRVKDPVAGDDLNLTIDLDLQRVAEDELDAAIERARGAGYAATGGAVVAIDPRNGEILALASRPNFDPQLFVGGISGTGEMRTFEYLNSEAASYPFSDRAITGGQPAASTFKPFTGLAGLTIGVIDAYTTVTDTGECWQPTGSDWGCWQSWRENSPNYAYLGTSRHPELRRGHQGLQRQVLLPGGGLDLAGYRRPELVAPLLRAVRLRPSYRHRLVRRDRREGADARRGRKSCTRRWASPRRRTGASGTG